LRELPDRVLLARADIDEVVLARRRQAKTGR